MKLTQRQEKLLKRTFLDYQQTSEFIERPLVLDKAEGLYYWDTDGKRYFDAIGGIFVAVLGHRHPRIIEAVKQQMEQMTFTPPPPFEHMFTHTLPAFREMGLTAEEETAIMRDNPQRILTIK